MGCSQTRDKMEADYLTEIEKKLQFSRFTVKDIKKAFCHASGAESVSLLQIEKFLKNLKIHYNPKDRSDVFDMFIKHFEIGEDTYDLNELLISIFLLTNSSTQAKGVELFDIFAKRSAGCLYKEEAETAFSTVCEVVCRYTEGFLDQEEDIKAIHYEIANRKVYLRNDIMVPRLVKFFFKGRALISYENFQYSLINAKNVSDLVDLTSPLSIRKATMSYLYLPFKSKIELQHLYAQTKSKAQHAFKQSNSSRNRLSLPTASFHNSRSTFDANIEADVTI